MESNNNSDTLRDWERECAELTPGSSLYGIPGVTLFFANKTLEFGAGTHTHEEYEFTMPISQDLPSLCDGNDIVMEKMKLTPYNSNQPHGCRTASKVNKMVCLSYAKDYVERVALEAFGKPDVVFKNESFDPGPAIHYHLGRFIEEGIAKQPGYRIMQEGIAKMLLIEILRMAKSNLCPRTETEKKTANESAAMSRAMDFLSQQSLLAFSMEEAADTAGMSPYYFIRRFRQFTGKTPYNYYMDCKMERARQLLSDKRKSITEVAEETGFSSASHFSTIFKRATGMTPSKFRSSSC